MVGNTQETDASRDEYGTYAPAGETCPVCVQPIKPLEPVRRGSLPRESGPPQVVYRHTTCAHTPPPLLLRHHDLSP